MRRNIKEYRRKIKFFDLLGIVGILIIWYILSLLLGPTRLPSPISVGIRFFMVPIRTPELAIVTGGSASLLPHLAYTVIRTITGASAGSILGIGLGMLMGLNKTINNFIKVPLEAIRAIPPLGLIPFLLMWFGPGPISQFMLITLYCFLTMVIYTIGAIRNLNPVYVQFAYTLGASRKNLFSDIIFPAAVPELIGGIRVSLAMSWGLEVVAEMLGAPMGLGKFFVILIPFFSVANIMAGIIWIVIIALIFDRILLSILLYIIKWVPR